MEKFVLALILILIPTITSAQLNVSNAVPSGVIKIYGHPEANQYDNPSQWPLISGQGHWCPGNDAVSNCDGEEIVRMAHGHIECQYPIYGYVTGDMTFPCRIQLFHVQGRVFRVDLGRGGILNDFAIWEKTGTNVRPPIIGNPSGVVIENFTMHIPGEFWGNTKHGAAVVDTSFVIGFDNGDTITPVMHLVFFAALDINAPLNLWENNTNPNYKLWPLTIDNVITSARGKTAGNQILRINDYIPLPGKPITPGRRIAIEAGRYGTTSDDAFIPAGFTELRNDVSLHSLIGGTLVERVNSLPGNVGPVVVVHNFLVDPGLPVGNHNALIRSALPLIEQQNGFAGNESQEVLVTFPFTSGENIPIPVVDDDGDGVLNPQDVCPNSVFGKTVASNGCTAVQLVEMISNLNNNPTIANIIVILLALIGG